MNQQEPVAVWSKRLCDDGEWQVERWLDGVLLAFEHAESEQEADAAVARMNNEEGAKSDK